MNKAKWIKPNMPTFRLVTKLMEEVGEVAKEFNNAIEEGYVSELGIPTKMRMVEELEHVLFIAEVLRDNVQADIETRRV